MASIVFTGSSYSSTGYHEKASTKTFSLPGLYTISKLYALSDKTHRGSRPVKFLVFSKSEVAEWADTILNTTDPET